MHETTRTRLREARKAAGHSLRSLASLTGISASQLSQIEQGKSEPSVSSLFALVSALNISLDELLDPAEEAGVEALRQRSVEARKTDAPAPPAYTGRESSPQPRVTAVGHHHPVISPSERPILEMESGVRWERLTRDQIPGTDTLLVTYHPGGKSSSDGKLMVHSGTEVAYIISGELTLQLGFETYILKAGDSMAFESHIPHLFFNRGEIPAVGIWLVLREGLHAGAQVSQTMQADSSRPTRASPNYRPNSRTPTPTRSWPDQASSVQSNLRGTVQASSSLAAP